MLYEIGRRKRSRRRKKIRSENRHEKKDKSFKKTRKD